MKKFLIVGTPRTGSSALAETVGLHPEVTCGWELKHRVPPWQRLKVIDQALNGDFTMLTQLHRGYLAKVFNPEKTWLGFRELFRASDKWLFHPRYSPALWMDRLEPELRWLMKRPDISIIHIVRRDNLDWLKSKFLADKTRSYFGKSYPEDLKIMIPLREAEARIRAKDWIDSRLAMLARSNPYFRVNYEDLLADKDVTAASALRFLACEPHLKPTREAHLKRQSKGLARDYILNHDELLARLEFCGLMSPSFDRV